MASTHAEVLRISEERRDASDKIMGFIYQDMLTIELVIKSESEEIFYSEWVEDIFVESQETVQIYQVKYYPRTELKVAEIFKGLYFQYLKEKLYNNRLEKKEIKFYLNYHGSRIKNVTSEDKKGLVISENLLSNASKSVIKTEFESKNKLEDRVAVLISKVSSSNLLRDFEDNFSLNNYPDADTKKDEIKDALHDEFLRNISPEKTNYKNFSSNYLKEILFAVSIQFVHNTYYSKPSSENHSERGFSKSDFFGNLVNIIEEDAENGEERLLCYVRTLIDEIYSEILFSYSGENTDEYSLALLNKIFLSTKNFFDNIIASRKLRVKLLNTIGTGRKLLHEEEFHDKNYELENFLIHRDKLDEFVTITWKIMLNMGYDDFAKIVVENKEHFYHKIPEDKKNNVLLVPSSSTRAVAHINTTMERVGKFKIKPSKWFLKGCPSTGEKIYDYKVTDTNNNVMEKSYDISRPSEENGFIIKCLGCIDVDVNYLDMDSNVNFLFESECREMVVNEN